MTGRQRLGAGQFRPVRSEDRSLRLAGLLWLAAGVCYLACEAIAAAAFPGYSYAANYISDLGVPYAGTIDGRVLDSRLAWVMNLGGFILDGILFAGAGILASRDVQIGNARRAAFLVPAIVHSLGTIVVGTVHSGNREVAAGVHPLHVIGAAMAIVGGNLALIAAASLSRRRGAATAYRIASGALGLCGLLGLVLLEVGGAAGLGILPDGVFERLSVYPITAWEIMTGLVILGVIGRRA